jgi:hypothetical protein
LRRTSCFCEAKGSARREEIGDVIVAFSGPYDNCTCPSGYTLDVSGSSPACTPSDSSWSAEAPTCSSVPTPPAGNPADYGVPGPSMLFLGAAALGLVFILYEM